MSGHNKVYGFCENGCKVEVGAHSKAFTYEVNSDASLAYWLSNKQAGTSSGGNDFTSVLIRKGEWNFTGNTVALDTIGTLYVEGEAGSKLVFTDTENALWYNTTDLKTSMINVTVNSKRLNSSIDLVCGFYNCSNLTKCVSVGSGGTNTLVQQRSNVFCFYSCSNLTDCISFVQNGRNGYSFYACSNLVNCICEGCYAANTDASKSFGFYKCTVVHGCKASGHCKTSVFNSSYASHSETSTYACADTADGGFNDTTNPAAT